MSSVFETNHGGEWGFCELFWLLSCWSSGHPRPHFVVHRNRWLLAYVIVMSYVIAMLFRHSRPCVVVRRKPRVLSYACPSFLVMLDVVCLSSLEG